MFVDPKQVLFVDSALKEYSETMLVICTVLTVNGVHVIQLHILWDSVKTKGEESY